MLADSIPFNESFEGYLEKYYSDEHVKFAFTVYFYMTKESSASRDNYTKEDLESYFYPDPGSFASNYTEGEYLKTSEIKTSAGKVYRQNVASFGSYWSENEHIMMSGFKTGDYVDFVLPAEKAGDYALLISFTKAPPTILRRYDAFQCVHTPSFLKLHTKTPLPTQRCFFVFIWLFYQIFYHFAGDNQAHHRGHKGNTSRDRFSTLLIH